MLYFVLAPFWAEKIRDAARSGNQLAMSRETDPVKPANLDRPHPDPIDVEVGLTLRRLRNQRKLSQTALADALGVTFQQIQKYERGTNRIAASTLVRAARALDVRPADLLPAADAPPLPEQAGRLLHVRGADQLLQGYAALPSNGLRRAILNTVFALQPKDPAR
jgi:transcriptional regulator with XRE-family HTH domain